MLLVYSLNSAQNIGIGSLETLELLLSSVIILAAFGFHRYMFVIDNKSLKLVCIKLIT